MYAKFSGNPLSVDKRRSSFGKGNPVRGIQRGQNPRKGKKPRPRFRYSSGKEFFKIRRFVPDFQNAPAGNT
jgi:hypothetical protein